MESKHVKNVFFAGEVVDIDGETGGFNFQSAWTTAFLAAKAITSS
jgi:predicted flavoprotein YhiN